MIHHLFVAKSWQRLRGFIDGASFVNDSMLEFENLRTYTKLGDMFVIQVDEPEAASGEDIVLWHPVDIENCERHDI